MSGRKPGPARQPVEMTILKGNPSKRPIPRPPVAEKPSAMPPVPSVLKGAGREAWDIYWRFGKAWLAYTDIPLVRRLCRLIDRADETEKVIDEEGFLNLTNSGRSSVHHSYSNLMGIYRLIGDLEREAGFTPAARAGLKAEPPSPGDEVDKWLAGTG
jgi:hypothetical protein